VTAENPLETDDITYCNVMSERGVFRSRSVTVIDPMQQGLLLFNDICFLLLQLCV